MSNLYFGVIKISKETLLGKLNSTDINLEKAWKNVYLWAILDQWPPISSGIAFSKKDIDRIVREHGLDTEIDYF
ncbi:MAG: hypothetical protein ACXWUD_05160 [Methylosarcina sp.]